jgi:hypothetical protein
MHKRRRLIEALLVLLILAAGGYLRLVDLETTWIGGDQSGLLSVAMEFVNLGKLPLAANKSSAGIINPPLVEYLYALPLFLTGEIISVAWFTALANMVSVGLCYGFTRRFFGARAALMAAFLYAVSPWAVNFSRLIWNPTTIPLFSTLALGCLIAYFSNSQRPGWLVGSLVCLACVIQLHWASVVLIAVVGISCILLHRRVKVAPMVAGIALFAATFFPYLLYEQANEFANVKALLQAGSDAAWFNTAPVLIASDLVSAKGVLHLQQPWFALDALMRWWLWGSVAYLSVLAWRSAGSAWRSQLQPKATARLILVLWATVPIALNLRHTHYLQQHYFLYLFPALHIIIATATVDVVAFLWALGKRLGGPVRHRVAQATALTLLIIPLAVSGQYLRTYRAKLASNDHNQCHQLRHVTDAIAQTQGLLDETGSHDLVVFSEGANADQSKLGLIRHFLEPEVKVRFVRLGDGLSIPSAPTVHLVAGEERRTLQALDEVGHPVEHARIVLPCTTWTFYTTPSLSHPSDAIGEWQNGLRLSEYRVGGTQCPGGSIELTMVWDVGQYEYREQIHFFNHLMSSDGALVSQYDGAGVSSRCWIPGDRLVTWFTLPLPHDTAPGMHDLYSGLYAWPSLERVGIASGGGSDDRLWLTSIVVRECE